MHHQMNEGKSAQAPGCDWNVAGFYLHNGLAKVRQLRCYCTVFLGVALHAV